VTWIKNTQAYITISKVLKVESVWKAVVTELVKWWNINPISNPSYFLESWIYGKIASYMWMTGTKIADFISKRYRESDVVKLFEKAWNLFGKISLPVIRKWKDISWEALLATVGTINKMEEHPQVKQLIDKQIAKWWSLIVNEIFEEKWHYKSMDLQFGSDGSLKIDSSWFVYESNILAFSWWWDWGGIRLW